MKEILPVSVIIPCYRCKATIERAVLSVAEQTMLPNEVILVDDYSEDGTVVLLHQLKKKYDILNFRIVELEQNRGPASARNSGWDLAKNPHIAFLDADDAWHPNKLEIQYEFMRNNKDIDVCGHDRFIIKKGDSMKLDPELFINNRVKLKSYRIKKRKALLKNPFACSTVMLKREIIFRFIPDKYRSEDYLLWLTILLSGLKISYIDFALAYSYKRPYGEGGLSENLTAMQRGNLDTYNRLHAMGLLNTGETIFYKSFSMIKFTRRIIVNLLRKTFNKYQ